MRDDLTSVPGTEQGTDSGEEATRAARARSLANLRPPFRKGETGNPRGLNGRNKSNEITAFLDQPEKPESERTRFEALIERLYKSAVSGNVLVAKTLLEYKLGKPSVRPDVLAIAEHLRRVELDRVQMAVGILSGRGSLDTTRFLELLKDSEIGVDCYLDKADQFLALSSTLDMDETSDSGPKAPEREQLDDSPAGFPPSSGSER